MKKIMHVGLDVDDNAFHGCGIYEKGGKEQMIEFKTKPSIGALMQKLGNFKKDGFQVKTCYEATYLGFSLARELHERDMHCDVIAPSSIPRSPDKTVKTDRIDAKDIAKFYKNGLLTVVNLPDEKMEQVRDLIRTRIFIGRQLRDVKRHILSTCRRANLNYKASVEFKNPAYFTILHITWLETQLNLAGVDAEFKFNIKTLLGQMRQLENQLEIYDERIEQIAEGEVYKKKVEALSCYRGIDVISAMVLITELGNIERFSHPRKLTSYAGMDLREYSSGGKERRYSMSKMGNLRVRTSVVEACQKAHLTPILSKRLKDRRKRTENRFVEVADRCMKRLHKKSVRMLYAGKPINKIKVACAREMLGFVWESLRLATVPA
jgi:transposase